MEIDALVTAVQEMGRMVEVPTPTIDVVLALVQQRGDHEVEDGLGDGRDDDLLGGHGDMGVVFGLGNRSGGCQGNDKFFHIPILFL